jgi:prepilin signal peptidase PulO-like enzyme (type II secretory pathway)
LLALTLIYSIIQWNFSYFLKAIGFAAILYAVGNLLYYTKLMGGGDVKLITAISPVFLFMNIFNFLIFLMIASGLYGIIYSLVLALIYEKELIKKLRFNFLLVLFVVSLILGIVFESMILIMISMLFFVPYLIMFVSAVEKVALVKLYPANKLTEGDWLLRSVKIGKTLIKAKAEGLTKEDIAIIKKAKSKVWIKEGIPYIPVFLMAFIMAYYFDIVSIIKAFF